MSTKWNALAIIGHEHDALLTAALERRANEAVDLLLDRYGKTGALVGEALSPRAIVDLGRPRKFMARETPISGERRVR